jgi:hypothetical protein
MKRFPSRRSRPSLRDVSQGCTMGNAQLGKEFSDDLAVIAHAIAEYLPATLKLSVHSAATSSTYAAMRRPRQIRRGAREDGRHHVAGRADRPRSRRARLGEAGLRQSVRTRRRCASRTRPSSISITPIAGSAAVQGWTSEQYTSALRHDPKNSGSTDVRRCTWGIRYTSWRKVFEDADAVRRHCAHVTGTCSSGISGRFFGGLEMSRSILLLFTVSAFAHQNPSPSPPMNGDFARGGGCGAGRRSVIRIAGHVSRSAHDPEPRHPSPSRRAAPDVVLTFDNSGTAGAPPNPPPSPLAGRLPGTTIENSFSRSRPPAGRLAGSRAEDYRRSRGLRNVFLGYQDTLTPTARWKATRVRAFPRASIFPTAHIDGNVDLFRRRWHSSSAARFTPCAPGGLQVTAQSKHYDEERSGWCLRPLPTHVGKRAWIGCTWGRPCGARIPRSRVNTELALRRSGRGFGEWEHDGTASSPSTRSITRMDPGRPDCAASLRTPRRHGLREVPRSDDGWDPANAVKGRTQPNIFSARIVLSLMMGSEEEKPLRTSLRSCRASRARKPGRLQPANGGR